MIPTTTAKENRRPVVISKKPLASSSMPQQPLTQKTLFSFFKTPEKTVAAQLPSPTKPSSPLSDDDSIQKQVLLQEPSSELGDDEMDIDEIVHSNPNTDRIIQREKSQDNILMDIEKDEISNNGNRSRSRRLKRVQYFEPESETEETKPLAMLSSAEDSPVQKKRRLVRRSSRSFMSEDDTDYIDQGAPDDDEDIYEEADISELSEAASSMTPKKKALSPPKIPSSKLQSFASSSTAKRGSFMDTARSNLITDAERKKEKAKQFKEKNEERYSWLLDLRDSQLNRPDSPDYDPRTLFIPPSAWAKFTAFEKQFWEIKSKHWDTVVFFKKGKFYELYEKDADIGANEFDLKLTDRVNMRMVGVPESSFDDWAARFIANGHKVAKVDQMETAIGKSMRDAEAAKKGGGGKEEKIIRRELTSVLTAGTLVDSGMLTQDMSTYCMSIKEEITVGEIGAPQFGICFVDTSTARFELVGFEDDENRTRFETLMMQVHPRELIVEKGCLSQKTARLIKRILVDPLWNAIAPEKEFWDAEKTRDEIIHNGYFDKERIRQWRLKKAAGVNGDQGTQSENDMKSSEGGDEEVWPQALKAAIKKPLVMSAFGGLIWYLRTLKLDMSLLPLGQIYAYDPIRSTTSLVLDGQTLQNLEIFQNTYNNSDEGSLFRLLNHCITPYGKRLFKRWLCHPLRDRSEIEARLDAVEVFMKSDEIRNVFARLARGPDLERLIARIHGGSCKVKEFLGCLDGFRSLISIMGEVKLSINDMLGGQLHGRLGKLMDGFPDLEEKLKYFDEAFKLADVEVDYSKVNTMIPHPGVDADWDAVNDEFNAITKEFAGHLNDVKKRLGTSKIVYKDVGKEIFQLEIPVSVKQIPSDWNKVSGTSKVHRYYNPLIITLVKRQKEAIERKNAIVKTFTSRVYTKFDTNYSLWLKAVQITAELDCLMSLAKANCSLQSAGAACRPVFVDYEKGRSFIDLEEVRHPCVVAGAATDFIPNDTRLGNNNANIILLTGPNMGGKSTLLRQTCITVIMAQLGCYVPARCARLTPIDRIYTRIGASDNILAGQSTFMVELAETSKILHEATPQSLVILDELGRGTSTFDGYAIAYAVLYYLVTHVGCLGLFSTHYQSLCGEFEANPNIANMHMAYHVDANQKDVTFLYKLTAGACQKSFGMNVANLAGVPRSIVLRADTVAEQFEQTHLLKHVSNALQVVKNQVDLTRLSNFSYLMRVAAAESGVEAEDIGDRAIDTINIEGRKERQLMVLRRIIGELKKEKQGRNEMQL